MLDSTKCNVKSTNQRRSDREKSTNQRRSDREKVQKYKSTNGTEKNTSEKTVKNKVQKYKSTNTKLRKGYVDPPTERTGLFLILAK
jgi:hypothetical protein